MSNQQGNQVTTYRYDAFGNRAEEQGNGGNEYKYLGQALDVATNPAAARAGACDRRPRCIC